MSELREPLHQPPNPADLRRVPPTSPDCARVRGWLRDFVDQDLERDHAAELEEHVHRCRVCAVELARAEHEALRCKRLFVGIGPGAALPAGFAARVVERLVLDETSLVSRDTLARAAAAASSDAGRGVGRGAASTAFRRSGPAMWLASALLLVLALGVGLEILGNLSAAPRREARLVVVAADDAYDGSGRLRAGSGLGDRQWLWVSAGGGARLDWHDPSAKAQPAATLQVHGLGQVRMADGSPVLVSGRADVVTHRPVSIPLADGNHVDLGVGEYTIAADNRDGELAPGEDPLAAMPQGLMVSVQVHAGDAATIVQTGGGPTLVGPGEVGIYHGGGPVNVGPLGGGAAGGSAANNPGTAREPVAGETAAPSALIGHLFDRSGVPALGAEVLLSLGVGGATQYGARVVGLDGSFALPTSGPVSTAFAITVATPPGPRRELGILAPDAVPLVRYSSHVQLAAPLVFDLSAPVFGQVRDELGMPRGGVTVLPCIVDELFGCVLPLTGERVATGPDGAFRIDRLPARLPPHEGLVLVVLQDGVVPAVVPVPARGSSAAGVVLPTIEVQRLRLIRLHQLPANTMIEVLEELPHLAPGTALCRRKVTTDAQGRVQSMSAGFERMWVRVLGASLVRELQFEPTATGLPRFRPFGPVRPYSDYFRSMLAVPAMTVDIVSNWRHQRTTATGAEITPADGVLQLVDEGGRPVAGVQLFGVDPTGPRGAPDARFLGLTSAQGLVGCPAVDASAGALLAIAADGSTATLVGGVAAGTIVPLVLAPTGRVLLDESLWPQNGAAGIVTMRFQRVDAVLPGVLPSPVRFATAASGWEVGDLPAGEYRVGIGAASYTVMVPAGGFVVLP